MRRSASLRFTIITWLLSACVSPSAYAGAISTGSEQSYAAACAITVTSTVKCWGSLGASGKHGAAAPTTIRGTKQIASVLVTNGGGGACALTKRGRVLCWGQGPFTGSRSWSATAVAVAVGRAKLLFGGKSGSEVCAILARGGAACWGATTSNGDTTPLRGKVVKLPAVGDPTAAASTPNPTRTVCGSYGPTRSLRCMGSDEWGLLGDGLGTILPRGSSDHDGLKGSPDAAAPVDTGVSAVTSLGMYFDTACADTAEQRVFCWGVPYLTATDRVSPLVPVGAGTPTEVLPLSGSEAIAVSQLMACGLRGGAVLCFDWAGYDVGLNTQGYAADASWVMSRTREIQLPESATTFDSTRVAGCALTVKNEPMCWGLLAGCKASKGRQVKCTTTPADLTTGRKIAGTL